VASEYEDERETGGGADVATGIGAPQAIGSISAWRPRFQRNLSQTGTEQSHGREADSHTDGGAQIIGVLREADAGLPVKALFRKHGFSEASYYAWKAKFGDMNVSDTQRF
jgi:hypothetical protein